LAAALTIARGGCTGAPEPDPVSYTLRFQPESRTLSVVRAACRRRTPAGRPRRRRHSADRWVVDDQSIATLDNFQLSVGSPVYATIG
jgi:hypothetical protein